MDFALAASRWPSQQSSILTYWKPWAASPLWTMASAAARTLASLTALGPAVPGVPAHRRSEGQLVLAADDREFPAGLAQGVLHGQSPPPSFPLACSEPLMIPVAGSSDSPSGRLRAEKLSGPSPVAGMRNRNGRPGVLPVIAGCGSPAAASLPGPSAAGEGWGWRPTRSPSPRRQARASPPPNRHGRCRCHVVAERSTKLSTTGAAQVDREQLGGLIAAHIAAFGDFFAVDPDLETDRPLPPVSRPRPPWR